VRAGEETGYSPEGAPAVFSSPAAWVEHEHGEAAETRRLTPGEAAEAKHLTEEGFRAAERLGTGGSNKGGASLVLEFGTPSAAQHELAAEVKEFLEQSSAQHVPSSQFTVATIPGSHGAVSGEVADVWFSEGSCLLGVGDEEKGGKDPKPAVIAGALKVYARTAHSNGACRRTPASK
jgi:hypothetical protein